MSVAERMVAVAFVRPRPQARRWGGEETPPRVVLLHQENVYVCVLPPSLRPTYVQRPYLLTYLTNYLLSYMIIHTGRTGILYIDHDITILNEVSNSGARTDRE